MQMGKAPNSPKDGYLFKSFSSEEAFISLLSAATSL